ncbi:hypothetical protein M9H77_30422 [Catharanthus roseus]|uniref:Uncharacterized protein n=1 Tax=Catharanthus roseus TaxID=4058 RepID=A0ACB9ZY90_CATRO|nr:hypothetical protein M9H77_30422 [Catharanthus roseus]
MGCQTSSVYCIALVKAKEINMQNVPNAYQSVEQLNRVEENGDHVNDSMDDFDGEYDAFAQNPNRDDYNMLTQVTDTSAAQARKGKDIQGIPWHRLNITREDYRLTRIMQYQNYENIPSSGDKVDKDCLPTAKGCQYYEFFHNTRLVKPTILHFQLRNLVWSTSKHDVYIMSNNSILHWSSLFHNLSEVLNFSGHITPTEKHAGCLLEGFTQTQISTMAVRDQFVVAGGFQGELICKRLDKPGVSFCTRTTFEDNAITNSIEIYDSMSGGVNFMASNNDCGVREYDLEKYQHINSFRFPWPVNHTSISPDRKLLTVLGDDLDGLIVDAHNGKVRL